MLTDHEKTALLQVARASIGAHLSSRRPPHLPGAGVSDATGVFVTIKRHGELRGCLGVLQLRAALVEEVARCARDSATEDPRFPPMKSDELADATLEISVLGPLEEIDPRDEPAIVIGRDGLVVEHGQRRGLLLPQVAVEWGWSREQFLRHTCRKAGLPDDAWAKDARVFRFSAIVFGETGR
ncbi:MAG: AmmeMemoRadiSam system protein A [Acidobacteria bacterium]|nr:AmmeMemoRadiSam system protein A [Acidobacteriota bacterium]